MLIAGVLFILVGIGFKIAAVPFHFWCPDVFHGAAAEVAGRALTEGLIARAG